MTNQEKAMEVIKLLGEYYPMENKCYLHYETPWQLLFATILSAQCTDDRVNMTTKDLFVKYPTLEDFAAADLEEMEKDVKQTGFYHHKAKNIIMSARMLLEEYNGEVPSDMDQLTKLPGVGRKTANVIRGHIFEIPSVIVDTHVKRISQKLGLTKNTNPEKIEYDLMEILPEAYWTLYNLQIIAHGRKICKARNPECGVCFLKHCCCWHTSKE